MVDQRDESDAVSQEPCDEWAFHEHAGDRWAELYRCLVQHGKKSGMRVFVDGGRHGRIRIVCPDGKVFE